MDKLELRAIVNAATINWIRRMPKGLLQTGCMLIASDKAKNNTKPNYDNWIAPQIERYYFESGE